MSRLAAAFVVGAFVVGLFGVGVADTASAADMALKAPLASPPFTWTGPTLGISGGGGSGHSNQTDSGIPGGGGGGPAADGSFSLEGGLFGGGLGYNWQHGQWVFGLAGDYSWADLSGSSDACGASAGNPHSCGTRLESLGTVRGLLGPAMGPRGTWLPYVTGGLAFGEVHAWDDFYQVSGNDFRTGWTVGAGVQMAFAQNWSLMVEYLYVDLGKDQMFDIVPGTPETVSVTANVIRGGFSYLFH
jgi:outer membrane immunogenic protein